MRRWILVAVLLAAALVLVAPAAAQAAEFTNEQCRSCHDTAFKPVDFSAPLVDRSNCNKCHWYGNHPAHGTGGGDCSVCHTSWPTTGNSLPWGGTYFAGAAGYFAGSDSASLDGPTLHAIHSKRSWPADVTSRPRACGSCHAPAACDACHTSVPHGDHPERFSEPGDPTPTKPYVATAGGAPVGAISFPPGDTFGTPGCAADECHGGLGAERITEDNAPDVVRSAGWTAFSGINYLGGTVLRATTAGQTLTVPFTGNQVSIWGVTLVSGGSLQIYIDDVLVDTPDLYEPSTHVKNGLWTSGTLTPGSHTLRIVTAVSPHGGAAVFFDRIVARDIVGAAKATPDCKGCHTTYGVFHGYKAELHTATIATTPEPGTSYVCGDCHSTDLMDEHGKDSTSGTRDCTVCHPTPRDSFAAWNDGCEQGGCHSAAPFLKHSNETTAHAVSNLPAGDSSQCLTCHTDGDLTAIHATASSSTPAGTRTGCLVCHGNPNMTLSRDCTQCHFTMDAHPGADHTGTYDLRSCDESGCHTASVSVTATGTTEDLVPIHTEHDASFACAGCHASTVRQQVKDAIAAGDKHCDACHAGAGAHREAHPASPPLVDAGGPHYGYVTGSAPGGTYTSDCAGCHTSNLVDEHVGLTLNGEVVRAPRRDAAGAALTCGTCHDAARLNVQQAVANGSRNDNPDFAACDDCHMVHAQIPATHVSSYKPEPEAPCADCHPRNLEVLHNYGMTTKTTTGPTLSGCALCHDYYTGSGPMGTAVQDAIDGGNATECTACHATYHQDAAHAATSPESLSCGRCHKDGASASSIEVTQTHAGVANPGPCKVCHANPSRVPDISTETAECASCHVIDDATGGGHAGLPVKHQSPTITAGCTGAKCHVADLPVTHDAYMGRYPQFADSCALCHDNPSRISDITQRTAACGSCHAQAGGGTLPHSADHTTTVDVTNTCFTCHEPAAGDASGIVSLHEGRAEGGCDVCHDNPTKGDLTDGKTTANCDQSGCHSAGSFHDDQAAKHTSTNPTLLVGSVPGCLRCHRTGSSSTTMGVEPLHAEASAGACAVCHKNPTRVSDITAETALCTSCHAVSGTEFHRTMGSKHGFTAMPATCQQSGCHAKTLPEAHAAYVGAGKRYPAYADSCALCHLNTNANRIDWATASADCAACHAPVSATAPHVGAHTTTAASSACTTAGCHAIGSGQDAATLHATRSEGACAVCHDNPARGNLTTGKTTADCAQSGCHATVGTDHHAVHDSSAMMGSGCSGCHFRYLDDEHAKLGYTCATCHSSSNSAVKAAITSGSVACSACHPAVNGKDRHQNQDTNEFEAANQSLHRVSSSLPGMRSSFAINGQTYTWTLPMASSFLKTGWTTSSVVTCVDCHNFGTAPAGPHGSTVEVNMDPAYAGNWKSARLGNSASTNTIICSKCHTNYSNMNGVHNEGDHEGSYCVDCHSNLPHGWKMPRLLAYTTDPAPYRSNRMTGLRLRNYSPNGSWDEGDCSANCEDHSGTMSNKWPSAGQTIARIGGRVTDSAAATGVVGATIRLNNGVTATTNSLGFYTFENVSGGAYTLTVTAAGLVTQTGQVTVAQNADYELNFDLLKQGTLGGTVTSNGAPVDGAAVTTNLGQSTTTANGGKYSFGGLPAGVYDVTFGKSGYTDQTKSVTVSDGQAATLDAALTAAPTTSNVARSKTVAYSSQYSSTYGAAKAVDGLNSTWWRSTTSGTQFLNVDLGDVYDLSKAVIAWNGSNHARAYRVDVSTNNTTWTTLYSTTSGTSGTKTHTFDARGRYIRLYCTQANSSYYGVNEFEAWGAPAPEGSVTGRVTSSGGTVIAGATVTGGGYSATTGADGRYTVAGVVEGTYTFTASATGYTTSAGKSVDVVGNDSATADFVLSAAQANAARGETFTATRSSSSYPPANAGDGSYSTYWSTGSLSSSNQVQSLQVDLGAAADINKIVVGWNGTSGYARSYRVEVSTDGSAWTSVYSTTSGSSSSRTVTFATRSVRYVRVYCTQYNSSSNGYRIYELEAWTP